MYQYFQAHDIDSCEAQINVALSLHTLSQFVIGESHNPPEDVIALRNICSVLPIFWNGAQSLCSNNFL